MHLLVLTQKKKREIDVFCAPQRTAAMVYNVESVSFAFFARNPGCACVNNSREMDAPGPSKRSRLVRDAEDEGTTQDDANSSNREVEEAGMEEMEEEGGGSSGDEDEDDERVREQMNEFFSELDVDVSRQKRNLMTEGLRVRPKRCKFTVSQYPTLMVLHRFQNARVYCQHISIQ